MDKIFILLIVFGFFISCNGPQREKLFDPKAIELNKQAVSLHLEHGLSDSALILLDKAIGVDPTYYQPHSNKSNIYLEKGEFEKALEESELLIQKKPDLAEGWTFAGMLHEWIGNLERARQCYQQGLDLYEQRILNPEKSDDIFANRLNRAITLIMLDREREGKEELELLKTDFPDNLMIDHFLDLNKNEYLSDLFD